MTGFTEKQRKALLTAGVTAAVYLSFKFILPLFLPFLISYLIALILRPSANFLERKLRVKRRGKTYAVPIGVIGGIEMILILALLGAGFFYGGRRLFMEANQLVNAVPVWVQNFDEWLTGMCHSVETFCRLQEGVLVKMVQDVLLGTARAFKNATMPNLVVNSVSVFGFFIKVAIITVILFIASILSLQEMDELRGEKIQFHFQKGVFAVGKKTGPDRKCMAENTGGDSVLDHLSLYPDIDSDWESLLYHCRHRNRPSGCAANLRNRDGPIPGGFF